MNEQQHRFVAAYLASADSPKAAIEAGYSARSASSAASRLLADPEIAAEIVKHRDEVVAEAKVTAAFLLKTCLRAVELAESEGNPAAMTGAIGMLAKLTGFADKPSEENTPSASISDWEAARRIAFALQKGLADA